MSIIDKFLLSTSADIRIPQETSWKPVSRSIPVGLKLRRRFRDYLWKSVKRHAYRWLKKQNRLQSIEHWPSLPDDHAEVMLRFSNLEATLTNTKFPNEVVNSTLSWWKREFSTGSQTCRDSCLLRWEAWWHSSGEAGNLDHEKQDEFWVAVVLSMSFQDQESETSVDPVSLASELANEFVEIVLAAKDRLVRYYPSDKSGNRHTSCNGWDLLLAGSLLPLASGSPEPSHQSIVEKYFSDAGKQLQDRQKRSRHIFSNIHEILRSEVRSSFPDLMYELDALTKRLALEGHDDNRIPLERSGSTAIERSLAPLQISASQPAAGTPLAEFATHLAHVVRSVTERPETVDLRTAWQDLISRALDDQGWSAPPIPIEILTRGSSQELTALKETAKHWIQRDDSGTYADVWQVLYHDTIATHLNRFESLISSQNTETLREIWTELALCDWIDDKARWRFAHAAERVSL